MKKILLFALLAAVILFGLVYGNLPHTDAEHYFHQINDLLKDADFSTAEVEDGQIILFDAAGEPIKTLPFDSYDKRVRLEYIRREGAAIFYITGGWLDDEDGMMFINDSDYNSVLDGVKPITRVSGNAYRFSTQE